VVGGSEISLQKQNSKLMTLKNVLLLNAISSGITGVLLVATPNMWISIFKPTGVAPFMEVGTFLILFSAFVLFAAIKKPVIKAWIKLIIALDITWVFASLVTVLLSFYSISMLGTVIILFVAAWVGMMAYLQIITLKKNQP